MDGQIAISFPTWGKRVIRLLSLASLKGGGGRKLIEAIFTQGMLSLTNFFVNLAIARYCSKNDYGMFVVLFTILGIFGNYHNALINTPLMVLYHTEDHKNKTSLIEGLWFGQGVIFLPIICLATLGCTIYALIVGNSILLRQSLSLSLATSIYLSREFIRSVNYVLIRINQLVKMDAVFLLLTAGGIWLLTMTQNLSAASSLFILGIGYFGSSLFGIHFISEKLRLSRESIIDSLKKAWRYSRWAVIGVTSDIFKNHGYVYILTALISLEALAEISLARLFLVPLRIFVESSGKITLTLGSDNLHSKGLGGFTKFFSSLCLLLFLVWLCYTVCLFVSHNFILEFFGDKYSGIEGFIFLWATYLLIFLFRYPITNGLLVFKEFKVLAKYDFLSAAVTVLGCFILIREVGNAGAILALILGEFTSLVCSSLKLISLLRSTKQKETVAPSGMYS